MQTAIHQERQIHLSTLARFEFQRIFDLGKSGRLLCPYCSDNVKLSLNIHSNPHFTHFLNKDDNCNEVEAQQQLPTQSEPTIYDEPISEINGFRMPKSRTITLEKEEKTYFKEAKTIKGNPSFKKVPVLTHSITSSYINRLKDSGVYLDRTQLEAVTTVDGPLLVVAGAGSGKTRVLTARTAYMIVEHNISPSSIMLVTFTAKAAKEMKERLQTYPGLSTHQLQQLVSGTFHSLFYRILCFHQADKWQSNKLLKWEWQREKILKEAGRELDLDEKDFAYDLALQQIGFWKNSLISPAHTKPNDTWEERVTFLYDYYEQWKLNNDHYDFDDMLIGCYQLFQQHPEILHKYQERFHYFLIDEFQDINKVQYELIKMMSSQSQNVCVVGDDDQSIYAFRGSDPSFLLHFEDDFKGARLITLDQNYRSCHEIVSSANQIISKNKLRRDKRMHGQYEQQASPITFFPYDEEEEATMIVSDIQEKLKNGASPNDFCVLFRTHSASRAMFERLSQSNIPFIIESDSESFYERRIVKTLLSFLRLANDQDDVDSVSNILPALFLKQSVIRDLKAESILKDCTLVEALTTIKTAHAFQTKKLAKMVPLFKRLNDISPIAAIEMVETEMGFSDYMKKRGNEGNSLDKGSDDLKDLKVVAKKFTTIPELLEYVQHMISMNVEIKKLKKHFHDVVTLSTIHRAKGLEYKTVYILGGVDGSIPHDYSLESLRNGDSAPLEEERRLLYVAMTRAREQLYISIPENRRNKKASPSRLLRPIL